MKKREINKRMSRAKGRLQEMMDFLRPYLPKKQPVVCEPAKEWKLPEDSYSKPGRRGKRNPDSL